MKVTPTKKKFGKYQPGDVFELADKQARLFIKVGKLRAADAPLPEEPLARVPEPQTYETRMLTAEAPSVTTAAPAKRAYVRRAPVTSTKD